MSDCTTFSNREGWPKWQWLLIGMAFDHKCEKVLDPTYCPDPQDQIKVNLFSSQNWFMYLVFTKVITEPSAVEILREYCNLQSSKFGDAQSAYANLSDHFSGGAIAYMTVTQLETKLSTMRLNRQWNKIDSICDTHITAHPRPS